MDPRFQRNFPSLSEAEQAQLAEKRVLIAGCGGLGGYAAELLVRAGVGALTLADGDCFSLSNCNRQLLATEATLGRQKAIVAAERARSINPDVSVRIAAYALDAESAGALVSDCDLVMDALDSVPARLLLADACATAGVTLVHGAVSGWTAQAAVLLPGSDLFRKVYAEGGSPAAGSVLSPAPALCAALQCAEALKLLTGRASDLAEKLLYIDMQAMDWTTVCFS